MQRGIDRAIIAAGGQSALARLVGVRPQAVAQWKRAGHVPDRHMDVVATATSVPAETLQGPSLRQHILDTLRCSGPLSAAEIQATESLHPNTVRIILARLVGERAVVKVPILPRSRIDPYFRYALAQSTEGKSNGEDL